VRCSALTDPRTLRPLIFGAPDPADRRIAFHAQNGYQNGYQNKQIQPLVTGPNFTKSLQNQRYPTRLKRLITRRSRVRIPPPPLTTDKRRQSGPSRDRRFVLLWVPQSSDVIQLLPYVLPYKRAQN